MLHCIYMRNQEAYILDINFRDFIVYTVRFNKIIEVVNELGHFLRIREGVLNVSEKNEG